MMKVAVIGAGPSGLVTLKYLTQAHEFLGCEPVEARLFEYQPQVGGTFAARVYEDAELVSSKQLTSFSDFRQLNTGDFLKATEIHLNARVLEVRRNGVGHTVVYSVGETSLSWDCDAVAVCSGLHVEPNIPNIRGLKYIPRVIHSSQFKARKQFSSSRTVMVVGSGETGADIAYLAVTTPGVERVVLCHRDGVHFAPKRNGGPILFPILGRKADPREPGIPIDVSRANLFDTAYVHNILRKNDWLLWEYYHYYIKSLLFICSGTAIGMDQWVGRISKERDHPSKIFFCKSMSVVHYISQPYRPQTPGPALWLYALRSALVQTPLPDTNGKRVDLAPWPKQICKKGIVQFVDNGRPEFERMKIETIRPDMIVLASGYSHSFPFFNSTDKTGSIPYPTPDKADVRQVWKRDDPTVGFIGFLRPNLGAIPPLSEMQAQLWVTNLLAPAKIPRALVAEDESHYRLIYTPTTRIKYGIDHESYIYQLGLDMNSAPGLTDIMGLMSWRNPYKSWKLLLFWAIGANLNTKFRLRGPWKWDGAADMMTSDEFWQTITRRPILFGHIFVSLVPMSIFGPISLACFLYTALLDSLSAVFQLVAGKSKGQKR